MWITEIVDGLIDRFAGRGECEFVREFARPLPVAVTARFFGIADEDLPLLEEWADLEVSGLSWMPQDRQDRQLRDAHAMGDYLDRLVRERAERPGDDFVSKLITLQAERDGQADLAEILAIASNVLAGGAATTQHMLGGAMLLLLEHPDQLERCRRDLTWIPRTLNEAMRLESSVQWVPRIVMRDTEIAGTRIPADAYVLIVFGSANRALRGPGALRPGAAQRRRPPRVRLRHPLLHRSAARAARGADRDRAAAGPPGRHPRGSRRRDPPRSESVLPRPGRAAAAVQQGAGMIRRIAFTRRAAGVGDEEFQRHWRGTHAELARLRPNLRSYVQDHAVLGAGGPLLPYTGFDTCVELEYDSREQMEASLSSPEYRTSAVADQVGFIDMSHLTSMLVDAHRALESPPRRTRSS